MTLTRIYDSGLLNPVVAESHMKCVENWKPEMARAVVNAERKAYEQWNRAEVSPEPNEVVRDRAELAQTRWLEMVLSTCGPFGLASRTVSELMPLVTARLREVVRTWKGESLLLLGPTGLGKTASAVAILRKTKTSLGIVWESGEHLLECRRRYPLGQGYPPEHGRAVNAQLLVVDDPDWTHSRDADELFANVCSARYNNARPMIVTSGATKADFTERYSDAVVRRITQSSRDASGKPTGRVVDLNEVEK